MILFGDDVFDIGDGLTSELDWRDMQFTYTYSFIRTSNVEVGFGAGIDAIQARAVGRVPARSIGEEATGAGAFPTAVLDGTWAVSKRFALNARVQYFSAAVGKFSGSLAEYHADLQYRLRRNFQMGIGYTVNRVIFDVSEGDFPGRFVCTREAPRPSCARASSPGHGCAWKLRTRLRGTLSGALRARRRDSRFPGGTACPGQSMASTSAISLLLGLYDIVPEPDGAQDTRRRT